MKILLGLTGSVASTLYAKLFTQLQTIGDVEIVFTKSATAFAPIVELYRMNGKVGGIWGDENEWSFNTNEHFGHPWQKSDSILHIELRDKHSVLVIAPCSANTLAKLANGLSDNLLTSVARAWDMNRLKIIAPAMNTKMWEHPITREHLNKLQSWGYIIVEPQSKVLACGEEGMGAMANVEDIVAVIKKHTRWTFPILEDICKGIPIGTHQGAFAAKRKYSIHTGIDLYAPKGTNVYAVERGKVVCVEQFTGPNEKTPWWLDTDCVLVEGSTGVICYGEIDVAMGIKVGKNIPAGAFLGTILPVLPPEKFRSDIHGHSVSMLHMELYPHGRYKPSDGYEKDKGDLIDPTPYLISSLGAPTEFFVDPKPSKVPKSEPKVEFAPDWNLHSICPVCTTNSIGGSRSLKGDNFCANGHWWFVCLADQKTVIGQTQRKI
jgi:phosphopantothenoylcysteine decarboxylase